MERKTRWEEVGYQFKSGARIACRKPKGKFSSSLRIGAEIEYYKFLREYSFKPIWYQENQVETRLIELYRELRPPHIELKKIIKPSTSRVNNDV